MRKNYKGKNNRNNPFKYGGYSMAQSYKDKITYKNKQVEEKRRAVEILNMLKKQYEVGTTPPPAPLIETAEGLYCIAVGEKFPFDFDGFPTDFNKMEMIEHPTFILSMSNIQSVELKQLDHKQPIEFRVLKGNGVHKHYTLILCKFNDVVQEFAFNPHLCKESISAYMKKGSNIFTVVALEGTTRVVKILRTLGFDDETKTNLYSLWKNMLSNDIPQSEYEKWYQSYFNYTPNQLWEKAEFIGKWVSID